MADDSTATADDGSRPETGDASLSARFDARDLGIVRHDDLGNAIWDWHPKVPGRREEDPTIDFIECLDVDGMTIADDESTDEDEAFDPYDHER